MKAQLGPLYRVCMAMPWDTAYRDRLERARANPGGPASASLLRVQASAQHLADRFEQVAYRNTWGTDLGMRIPEPLRTGADPVRE